MRSPRFGAVIATGFLLVLASCADVPGSLAVDEPALSRGGGGTDVGGEIFSSPGTVGLRVEWGSSYENSHEIEVTGDGPYSFAVRIRNNTKFRVVGTSAPEGWACRGKQTNRWTNNETATQTHVYCGATHSDGVRLGTWNLEWYDTDNPPVKKEAIAGLIDQWNFDVLVLTEVRDAAAVDDLIVNHLADPGDWEFRITDAGCSLKQATLWRSSTVTLESGYELNAASSGGIIDEGGDTWRDCVGRRPYVATFSVNDSDLVFTTASVHFKAGSTQSDCQLRRDQVDTLVEWIEWAGKDTTHFAVVGDFNDELPGNGICSSVNALGAMETRTDFTFATAQPDYHYAHMMGNGLVTFDTNSFQSTIDHIWVTDRLFDRLETAMDSYGNRANAVQANMNFTDWGEPDHNPPFVSIGR